MKTSSIPAKHEPVTVHYPRGLYWGAILLAVVAASIHVYFGIFVFTGTNMIPMLGIAAVYAVGVVLVLANVRRELWVKVGTGWAALLVVLWASAAFLGNAPHAMDPLAYVVNGVEVVLLISLVGLNRNSKIVTA